MRALPFILLALITAGFGWIAAAYWHPLPSPGEGTATVSPHAGADTSLALSPRTPTNFAPFLARPPFSAARRPPPPEAAGIPIAPTNPNLVFGRYEIAGVVMLGTSALAMLRDPSGALLRIRAGDQVKTPDGDADVLEITLKTLTFRHQGDTVLIPVGRGGRQTE